VLLTGGHSSVRRKVAAFSVAAASMGALAYGAIGAIGSLLPWTSPAVLERTFLLIGGVTVLWYLAPAPQWLPSSRRQVRREIARTGTAGAAFYGAVLGLGFLTIVVTPLVWFGLLASIVSGSAGWAAVYGAGFGLGRAVPLAAHWVQGDAQDATRTVSRAMIGHARILRAVGFVTGAALIVYPLATR
jgi:hypothetical protein